MSNRAYQTVDWNQPIDWAHPLNRGLFFWYLAVPGKTGPGSKKWKELCSRHTLVGTVNYGTSTGWGSYRPGGWGSLFLETSNSDSVDVHGGSLVSGYTQFVMSGWIKCARTTGDRCIHGERPSSGNWICKLELAGNSQSVGTLYPNGRREGGLEIVFRDDSGLVRFAAAPNATTSVIDDNEWHFVIGSRDGDNVYLYWTYGGALLESGAISISGMGSSTASSPSYIIGRDIADANGYFGGNVDDLRLYVGRSINTYAQAFELYQQSLTYYPSILRRRRKPIWFVQAGAFSITAEAASYTVTGTDASLEQGYSVAADAASYSVTGTAASLEQGYAIAADGASYTVTGTDATLLHNYVVAADAASYTVTGTDVTLTVGAGGTFTLTADAASYTVTGTDASLFHGYVLTAYNTASAGFVATSSQYYTGTTIAFGTGDFAFACWIYLNNTTGVKTIVSLGSVTNDIEHLWLTVSGTSLFMSLNDSVQATRLTWTFGAGFSTGWNHIVVNFDRSGNATCWINGSAPTAPTVDISGHAAALNPTTFYVGRKVAGSDYFDGRIDKLIYTNAILDSSEIAELSAGAKLSNFSSSLSAKTVYGWEMEAVDGGTQTSSFTSNDLVPTNTPTQEEGYSTGGGSLFTITGTAASLEQGYSISVDAASYTVTGTDATVEWNRVLSVDSATFTVSGTDVTLSYSGSVGFSLTAEGTQIVLNASNATLTYSALLNEFPELDFSTDYLIMDFPESVTYISKSQYGDTRYTVAKAIQAQPSHQERATSGGTYAGYDLTWLLPGVLMNTTPKISDVILDDAGTEWTIINAQYDQMDRMWNMQTVNLVLFFDLRDQIWLYKPDTASTLVDAAGRYTPTFTAAATLIPARIQEQRGDFSEERGKRGTQRTYQIFILEPITDITTEWYAQDTSGNRYDITGWTNKATITDLMTLEAVKRV